MAYKRYIKKKVNGKIKTFGPYYYESHRDEKGNVISKYISGPEKSKETRSVTIKKQPSKPNKKFLFILLVIGMVFLLFVGFFVLNNHNISQSTKILVPEGGIDVTSFSKQTEQPKENFVISNAKKVYSFLTGFVTEGEEESAPEPEPEVEETPATPSEEEPIEESLSEETPTEEESVKETPVDETPTETTEEAAAPGGVLQGGASPSEGGKETPSDEEITETTTTEEETPVEEVVEETPSETIGGGGGGTTTPTETNETTEEPTSPRDDSTEPNETETNTTITPTDEAIETNITIANETETNTTITNETPAEEINEPLEEVITNETPEELIIEEVPIENITTLGNFSINTTQYTAVLGQPVKWKKIISVEGELNEVSIEIPKEAENIIVYKITGEAKQELEEGEKTPDETNETVVAPKGVPSEEGKEINEPFGEVITNETQEVNETTETPAPTGEETPAPESVLQEGASPSEEGKETISQEILNETQEVVSPRDDSSKDTQGGHENLSRGDSAEPSSEPNETEIITNETIEEETPSEETIEEVQPEEKEKKEKKIKITAQVISEGDLDETSTGILGFFKKIFSAITGRFIDIEEKPEVKIVLIIESATEFEIEYETPAPVSNETSTSYGKEIIISSDIHYENILAFANLTNEVPESEIILYKIVGGFKITENFTAYDTNDNGLINYVEWNVASLSEVTYNLHTTRRGEIIDIELITCAIEYPIKYAIDNGFPVPDNFNVQFGRERQADVFRISIIEFIEMQERGEDYSIIQTHDLCGKAMGLFVLKGSKLKTNELEGKTIAFADSTPIDQAILKDVLENKYGLNTTNISFWFEYPVSAMMEGRADAGLVSVSVYSDFINDKDLSLFMDISEDYHEIYGSYPVRDVLVMKNEFNEENAKEVIEFLEAAYDFGYDHKRDMIQIYSLEIGYDASTFFNFVDKRKGDYLGVVDSAGTESVQKTSDTAEREKKVKKSPKMKDLVLDINATGELA